MKEEKNRDLKKGLEFAKEVYKHFGLYFAEMLENKEEHSWGIFKKEEVKEGTNNMLGFGMEQSRRIIIDYDKDYNFVLVRSYPKSAGRTEASCTESNSA